MRSPTVPVTLMALPLAYVSKILANPIYRRKAVKRICGIIFNQSKEMIIVSVPKSQRTDKSDVCYLASQIEFKIVKMTMNEKYFPKRARFIITNKIIDSAMNVSANCFDANAIFPTSQEKLNIREQYQTIGKANLSALEHQLNLVNRLFNIPSALMDDIFSDISELKKMYSNWVKSGKKILNRELEKQKNKQESKKGE